MTSAKMKLTARNPEDVLAMVPVVLGFTPRDSIVMLTFGAPQAFHARVDLPPGPSDVPEVVRALVGPAVRHGVRRVLLVGYSDDLPLVDLVIAELEDAFGREGVEVVTTLAADGSRWWALPCDPGSTGVLYDVSSHPFAAQAVLSGMVTHGSRDALAATLASDPDGVAALTRALARLPTPVRPDQRVAEAAWAVGLVRRSVAEASRPGTGALARLLVGLQDPTLRDAAWLSLNRADASAHIEFWGHVVRRTPTPFLAAPAAILGFAAWLAGHGALAWCAVDRSREADPHDGLAALLAQALSEALPPSAWDSKSGEPWSGRPA